MSVVRRREATRRLREEGKARESAEKVAREAAEEARKSAEDAEESAEALNQASVSAYMLAAIGVLVMLIFGVSGRDGAGAAGLACQTGAVLLVSPELLSPLGSVGYLRRPVSRIKARRRCVAYLGVGTLLVLVILLGMRCLDLAGFGSDTDMLGLLVLLGILVGFLLAVALLAVWMVEGALQEAAEGWLQEAIREADPERINKIRSTIAAVSFLLGTLLLFADAYR